VSDLTGDETRGACELHLDPDLRSSTVARSTFLPAFGQCGSEQKHLENMGVQKEAQHESSDLFLFFGCFRPAKLNKARGRWEYVGSRKFHVIHSWLQLGDIHRIKAPDPRWLSHPHGIPSSLVAADQQRRRPANQNNTIYTPRRHLTFAPRIPGYGTFTSFDCSDSGHPLRLSDPDSIPRSNWVLPMFFYKKLSHFSAKANWEKREQRCKVTQRGYGQEFVFEVPPSGDVRASVLRWLDSFPFAASAASASPLAT
jgi:hypothetical protein